MSDEKPKLAMLCEVREDHSFGSHYLHVDIRFGSVNERGEYAGLDWYHDLRGLELTSQSDEVMAREGRGLYAWSAEFNVGSVRLRDAERITKVLRSVHRRLDAAAQTYGEAGDFAGWVVRVAHILKVEHFFHFGERLPNGRTPIYSIDLPGLRGMIGRAERGWIAKYKPEEVNATA